MYNCTKHLDREALSFCHKCGKFYCKECLTEGKEYYYCSDPECQKQWRIDDGLENGETANPSVPPEEKEYVRLDIDFNKMDSSVFQSLLDNAEIDYYCTSGYFFDAPAEFYICADQTKEVEAILRNFNVNPIYYSTKNDLTD